ncbi:MAG: thaumatin family protein, partial [Gammaproteobacteria bacterium]
PVYQSLDIQYQGTQHLIAPLNYAITVTSSDALSFVPAQPAIQSATLSTNDQPSAATFSYTIQNSSTTAMPFQVSTPNSVTASDAVTFTNSCGGIVPANNGTCDINVYIVTSNTATSPGSPITHALNVNYGPDYSYRIQFIPTFQVTVKTGLGLIYSQVSAPNSQIINGATQQLLFKVKNNNHIPAQLSGVSIVNNSSNTGVSTTNITYAPIPNGDTACYSNAHFATLNFNQSCDFNLNISAPAATSTAGSVIQYLDVTSSSSISPTITQQLTYNVLTSALSFLAEPIAQDMSVGETQTLIYGIHNSNSAAAVSFNQAGVTFGTFPNTTSSGTGLISTVFTNSCNGIIPPNGNCSISAAITASAVGSVKNLALIVPNASSDTILESTFPITFQITSTPISNRTLTFTNNCPGTTIYIGLNGGASNNASSSNAPPNPHIAPGTSSICNTNADCPNGATCVTTNPQTNTKLCFWNSMAPASGYALAPGASTTATIPEYNQVIANDKNTVWSGNVSARTACSTAGLCQTADCTGASTTVTAGVNVPNSTGACFPGTGFTPPNALAEFTLSRASADFYDVSIINGANIPVSMRPTSLTPYQTTQNGNNGYICGEPGKTTSTSNGPGASAWSFTPPTTPPATQFANVLYNASKTTPCTSNATCNSISAGDICGLTFNPNLNVFQSQCGTFLGYWTGDQICGTNDGQGASSDFNCKTSANMANYPAATVTDLYKCDLGIPSCYNNPLGTNQCCGCANWDTVPSVGALVPTAPLVEACPTTTPTNVTSWNTLLQINGAGAPNNIAWLKAAVPSAYTYPYDDPSSTFTCPNCTTGAGQPAGTGCTVPSTEFNTSDYTITFCPGGSLIPTPP